MFSELQKFTSRLYREKKLATVGLIVLLILTFVAIFAPLIAPYDYDKQDLASKLEGPDRKHIFGRDQFGRDIFSRVIYGTRISLKVGLLVVLFSSTIGTVIGTISGYFSGYLDDLIMRIIDILLAFPGILLALAIMTVLGPSLNNVIIALCIIGWVS